MPDADPHVPLAVSVDDAHLDRIEHVAARLRDAGMRVERSLQTIGTITGSAPESKLAALRATEGVAAVERQREYQLPPPDSPVQ
jgi:hypothetical protein